MIRLEPPVGDEYEELVTTGLSDYERNKPINQPTHFTMELVNEGRYKGFDKVTYYRKKL